MEFLKKWGLLILVILLTIGLGVMGYFLYESQQKAQAQLSSITSEARKALEKTTTDISAERATTEQLAAIIDKQKEFIGGLEGELAAWQEKYKGLDFRFINLGRNYKRLSADSTKLTGDLGTLTQRFDELAKQNTANVSNYNALSEKLKDVTQSLSESQSQFNQLSAKNNQLAGQVNELTGSTRQLSTQLAAASQQATELNRQVAAANQRANEAAVRAATLERTVADLREQLKAATAPKQ